MPSAASSLAVPPVETISTPSSVRPRAKSTRPRLSEVVRRARRTATSPGAVDCIAPSVALAILDPHDAGILGVDPDPSGGYQPHRAGQQPVLDLVYPLLDLGDVARIRKLERLLQDDRPAVHGLLDVVDGNSHDLDPVVEGLLDGTDPGKRRQKRGVHVDDPSLESPDELRAEDLHEPGQHHELDSPLLQPVP